MIYSWRDVTSISKWGWDILTYLSKMLSTDIHMSRSSTLSWFIRANCNLWNPYQGLCRLITTFKEICWIRQSKAPVSISHCRLKSSVLNSIKSRSKKDWKITHKCCKATVDSFKGTTVLRKHFKGFRCQHRNSNNYRKGLNMSLNRYSF